MMTILYVSLAVIVCIALFFLVRMIVRKSIAKQLDLNEGKVLKLVHFGEKDACRQLKELMVAKTDAKIVEDTINRLPDNRKVPIAKAAVLAALKAFMADSYIDDDESEQINTYCQAGGFNTDDLIDFEVWQQAMRSRVVKKVMDGRIDEVKVEIQGDLPILLKKDETVLWLFNKVQFAELREQTVHYGNAIHVHEKGSYLGMSSFVSMDQKYKNWENQGKGILVVTDKNLYFVSPSGNKRIPINQLLSVNPFIDGIVLQEDKSTSKPMSFANVDGMFIYNIINNL